MGCCGALRRCGCAWTYEGTQFLCVKFRLGSAGEPTICSHCYSVPYMKIPANNQVLVIHWMKYILIAMWTTDTLVIPTDFFQLKINEMVIEIKMKMIPIIYFSIDAIGVSYIIVSIFKFIFTLINLVVIISCINIWLWQWLKFMSYRQWLLNQWLGYCLFIFLRCLH